MAGALIQETATTVLSVAEGIQRLHLKLRGGLVYAEKVEWVIHPDFLPPASTDAILKLSAAVAPDGSIIFSTRDKILELAPGATWDQVVESNRRQEYIVKCLFRRTGDPLPEPLDLHLLHDFGQLPSFYSNLSPMLVAVAPDGRIFACDALARKIYCLDMKTREITLWVDHDEWVIDKFQPNLGLAVYGGNLYVLGMASSPSEGAPSLMDFGGMLGGVPG